MNLFFTLLFSFLVLLLLTTTTSSTNAQQQQQQQNLKEPSESLINITLCESNQCYECFTSTGPQDECFPIPGGAFGIGSCAYQNFPCFHGILSELDNDCSTASESDYTNVSLACGSCFSPDGAHWFSITCDATSGEVAFAEVTHGAGDTMCSGTAGTPAVMPQGECTPVGSSIFHFKKMSTSTFSAAVATLTQYTADGCAANSISQSLTMPVDVCSDTGSLGCFPYVPTTTTTASPTTLTPPTTTTTTSTTSAPVATTTVTITSGTPPPLSSSTTAVATSSGASTTTGAAASSTTTTGAPVVSSTTSTTPTTTSTTSTSAPVQTSTTTTTTNAPTTTPTTSTTTSSTPTTTTTSTTTTTAIPTTTTTVTAAPSVDHQCPAAPGVRFNSSTSLYFNPNHIPLSTIPNMLAPGLSSTFQFSPCSKVRQPSSATTGCTQPSAYITQVNSAGTQCLLQATLLVSDWVAINAQYDGSTQYTTSFSATFRSLDSKVDIAINVACDPNAISDKLHAVDANYQVSSLPSMGADWKLYSMKLQSATACPVAVTPAPPVTPPAPTTTSAPASTTPSPSSNNGNSSPDSEKLAIIIGAGAAGLAVMIGVVCVIKNRGKKPNTSQHFDPSFPDDKSLYPTGRSEKSNNNVNTADGDFRNNNNRRDPHSTSAMSAASENDIEAPLNADAEER